MLNFKKIFEDYQPDNDIFSEEPEVVAKLKDVIFNRLSEIDRRVILLYAELQSQRKVAKLLGVSASTVNILIRRIRKEILEWL